MINIAPEVKRLLKKPIIWTLIIIASAGVWLLGFYWASQTPFTYTLRVWIGGEGVFNDELSNEIEQICLEGGMKKCALNAYSPNDFYYPAAFALQSNNVDIYVLEINEAETTAQAGIFRASDKFTGETFEYEGETIGVKFIGDYYIFINGSSKKDEALLFAVVNAISAYGEKV